MDEQLIQTAIASYGRMNSVLEPLRIQFWETYDLTMTQVRVMYLIRQLNSPSLRELATALRISGPTMTGLADRLIQRGVVQRRQDESDRRIVRVNLTSEGDDILRVLERAGRSIMQEAFESLGPDITARLSKDLQALAESVEHVLEKRQTLVANAVPSR